jgi:hypothetical protein
MKGTNIYDPVSVDDAGRLLLNHFILLAALAAFFMR